MAEIKLISECFVKPKHEVEAAKQPYHLSPGEVVMLSIHPIQKGLLFALTNQQISSIDRTQLVSDLLSKLKHSLSIALVHFYPLAGRFVTQKYHDEHASSFYVDCVNGPGARLIHAKAVHVTVSDIVSSTDVPTYVQSMFELGEKWVNYDGHTRALVSIQVTELIDGVFIGFTMNHSAVDGTSFIHFVTMLSEIYQSHDDSASESCTLKISRVPVFNYKPWITDDDEDVVEVVKLPYVEPEEFIERKFAPDSLRVRLFNFSPAAMASLKAKANEEQGAHNVLSSFQALCAFVWRAITRARNPSSDQLTSCAILINARSRFDPPITDDYVGNYLGVARVDSNVGELLGHGLGWGAMNLNKEIKSQDGEKIIDMYKMFTKSPMVLHHGEENLHGSNKVIIGGSARFDMYGPEFGLGRAVAARMGFGNRDDGKVTANPGCGGGGSVELEICLVPNSMTALESDSEFMCMVSLS